MAPSSKSGKDDSKRRTLKKHKDHVVKLLVRGQLSGRFSQRLFRKLPPRVCIPLKSIVSEGFLRAGHIFLGFTKCGRYVLSYTRDSGEDDYFPFYTYRLYWWEFNLHSRLKQVHRLQLFAGEEIYTDLYLTICEWPNDRSKIVIFGFNTRTSSSVLMNLMMTDENNRDIYITIASMPPAKPCTHCCPIPSASTIRTGWGECLEHGYVLNSKYQVVYPFPTFQPAFQVKKDQVILVNTSYALVACSISLTGKQGELSQILYTKILPRPNQASTSSSSSSSSSPPPKSLESRLPTSPPAPVPSSPSQSQAAMRAREFAAELFRRAQAGGNAGEVGKEGRQHGEGNADKSKDTDALRTLENKGTNAETLREAEDCKEWKTEERLTSLPGASTSGERQERATPAPPSSSSSSSSSSSPPSSSQDVGLSEPGYVCYSQVHYGLKQPEAAEPVTEDHEEEKMQLPFTVTDLKGGNLQRITRPHGRQTVCVEQLLLDFEFLINEVIRTEAPWAPHYCSFSDYDVVILEVCPEANTVLMNIGVLLLAYSPTDVERCRQNSYHSSLLVSWDLNTGVCCTMGIRELTEVKDQSSGNVWSFYRKSCVNTVMKSLFPENNYINRLTNEALHRGLSLQVLADSDRCTWIVL
ncbi:DDB1- and CUL4-associated factor 15 [Gouania willdenowi]|uniref:DDB1- and CUL4-associated factor 15 WD40 repeat-containing domain-containing protein n=1 Tax=Gouania willdenowi TaxID=441366 RepID=A0A8C5DZF8_GOUWI|nr:DDB1- and CUL4-associated factor 15 [Gouania willdenowi]